MKRCFSTVLGLTAHLSDSHCNGHDRIDSSSPPRPRRRAGRNFEARPAKGCPTQEACPRRGGAAEEHQVEDPDSRQGLVVAGDLGSKSGSPPPPRTGTKSSSSASTRKPAKSCTTSSCSMIRWPTRFSRTTIATPRPPRQSKRRTQCHLWAAGTTCLDTATAKPIWCGGTSASITFAGRGRLHGQRSADHGFHGSARQFARRLE